MKPQTLMSSIEYGKKLSALLQLSEIDYKQYFIYRTEFDDKIMQPPTIADFIPCISDGEKWRVLEKPENYNAFVKANFNPNFNLGVEQCKIYQTALDNVKFSGWEVKKFDEEWLHVTNGVVSVFWYSDVTGWKLSKETFTYNDLVKFHLPLTERGMEYFNINI